MNEADGADKYLSYHSVLRETMKLSKKVLVYLVHCTLFSAFFVYKTLNRFRKTKYKKFLHELARSWISETECATESCSVNCSRQKRNLHQGGLNRTPPPTTVQGLQETCWRKLSLLGKERRNISLGSVKSVQHT
jgi:hypothetical protein